MSLFQKIHDFFTDSDYRWVLKERIWLWILSRKPVIYIISLILAFHFKRRTKGMSRWESYQVKREYENSSIKWLFYARVFNLLLILKARDAGNGKPEDYESNRRELLQSELINNPEYRTFKHWLEHSPYEIAEVTFLENFYDEIMSK